MKLISLSLQNFRQHMATRITFDRGLTGIIGRNGTGKSTILEAIAFAIYGVGAARGKRDSIKSLRAAPRAQVRAELEFELAGHRYRVVRGLSNADCYLDGADTPIANTLNGVTELLERKLGMTRVEFFNTYFTGQKELAVMGAMSAGDRAKFLSRVLGYDRIATAQDAARDRKKAIVSECTGLRSAMPDADAVARAVTDADQRVVQAADALALWTTKRDAAQAAHDGLLPTWNEAQARRDRTQMLRSEAAVLNATLQSQARDIERLQMELRTIDTAEQERAGLVVTLAPLAGLRAELAELDRQAESAQQRERLLGVQQTVRDQLANIDRQLATLPPAADVAALRARCEQLRTALSTAEAEYDDARDRWTRETADAKADLQKLREQHESQSQQLATLRSIGPESACSTCGQRIGERFATVCSDLEAAIAVTVEQGTAAKARVASLSQAPAEVTVAQAMRADAQTALAVAEKALSDASSHATTRQKLETEHAAARERLATIEVSLSGLHPDYDATRHATIRSEVARLTLTENRVAVLDHTVVRAAAARTEYDALVESNKANVQRAVTIEDTIIEDGITDERFAAVRQQFETSARDLQLATDARTAAQHELTRAEESRGFAVAKQEEFASQRERLTMLEHERFVHEELDRALTDLRADLNAALRPELAEIASGLLETLTDGRYTHADFDENYQLVLMEDGLPKPVISGGEEDLCNLILRLAISQMIAQRAGHAFSLLILDEVFGSLDDARRSNVIDLLRRLNDRFEQVIVITHHDQVRNSLDHILRVQYDAETGTSSIMSENGDGSPSMSELLTDAVAA